jgi:hypothetical protein
MRKLFFLVLLCSTWGVLLAQSPAARVQPRALPANYSVELDNAYLRVTRASFKPHETVSVHLHPTFPTVYVYLTDSGPMRFVHITPSYTVMRAPVRSGGVRYNRNWHNETHVIEYLGDMPTEYLRVEMKTVPDREHGDERMAPEDTTTVEDAQVRISRHECRAGGECPLPSRRGLVISLESRDFLWVDPQITEPQRNSRNRVLQQIWIELKTGISK